MGASHALLYSEADQTSDVIHELHFVLPSEYDLALVASRRGLPLCGDHYDSWGWRKRED